MEITNAQYAVLSTFERSWLCRKVNDRMEINGPYASSEAAAKEYPKMPKIPYLKMAFMAFSLAHSSNETPRQQNGFSFDNLKKLCYQLFNSVYSTFITSSMKFLNKSDNKTLPSASNEPYLIMPDFADNIDVKIFSGKNMFLKEWSFGYVFVGSVNGTMATISVCLSSLMIK